MSFFSFTPASDGEPQRWRVSNRFWIYWVVTIPITALTLMVWYMWQKKMNLPRGDMHRNRRNEIGVQAVDGPSPPGVKPRETA